MTLSNDLKRRRFLQSTAALGLGAGLATWERLAAITPARAQDMAVGPDAARFRPEIEPVVRWIEETPRNRVFDRAVKEMNEGLSYRDLMAGLFLAGIRNIKPRPVGFKFHAVMVINSAHVLGQTAPMEDRLLPMFWALDNFKSSQAQDIQEGDWTLSKVDEAHVPSPLQAEATFNQAMDAWDADAADAAVAGLCRSAGAAGTMEAFWRYAVRDQRNIGHKPIFAMQCWRTLQSIGWEHAEPVLRSLAFGMLDTQGDRRAGPVGPYEANLENADKIRDDWQTGKLDAEATRSLLATIREASPEDASAEVLRLLNDGIHPDSLWDAVILAGSEMFIRDPSIAPLHAVTAANSLHYIYGASGDETTRKLALLQGAGWLPLYRSRTSGRSDLQIDKMEPVELESEGEEALAEIFHTVDSDRAQAAAKAATYLKQGGSAELFFAHARRLIFHKGRDSHDYKYGAAAWEEHQLATDPRWQPVLAAALTGKVPGLGSADSPLMQRARRAVEQELGETT
ncbi:hypothetical protein BH23PLA1_BH23PLA1_28440 [soil metagenome]